MNPQDAARLRTYRHWLHYTRNIVRQDADQVTIISGQERFAGKSTFAFHAAHHLDPNFSLDQCVFRVKDLFRLSEELDPYQVIWLDEATDMTSEKWGTQLGRELKDYFIVAGERNLIYLICFPRHQWIHKYVRDHRCHWLWHLPTRGRALLHYPRRSKWGTGTFWMDHGRDFVAFPPASGPTWERYLKQKKDHVDQDGRAKAGQPDTDDDDVPFSQKQAADFASCLDDVRKTTRSVVREILEWDPPRTVGEYTDAEKKLYPGRIP